MAKAQTDALGQEIRVGDILLSASKTGNVKVGRVEKIHDSGYITVKFAERRSRHAYEDGAPDIKYMTKQPKRDASGRVVTEDDPRGIKDWRGHVWQVTVYEEVEATRRDYTVTGHYWAWKQEEAAHYARFVVQSTADHPLFDLHKFLNLDYDKENPEMGDHDKIDDGANEPEGQDHFEEEDDDE